VPNPKLKLLDQMREVLRLRHYSIRTETSCWDWVRRYVRFHKLRSREELTPGEARIEGFQPGGRKRIAQQFIRFLGGAIY
jgi:hypothetical protein